MVLITITKNGETAVCEPSQLAQMKSIGWAKEGEAASTPVAAPAPAPEPEPQPEPEASLEEDNDDSTSLYDT